MERLEVRPFIAHNENVKFAVDLFANNFKKVLRDSDPNDLTRTWESARRVGRMFVQPDLGALPITQIEEELYYQGVEDLSHTKGSLRNMEKLVFAADPIIEQYTEMTLKNRVSDRRLDEVDLLDYVRKHVQKLIYWKIDTTEILNLNKNEITDYFLIKIYGNLKFIPKVVPQDLPIFCPFDNISNICLDGFSEMPEEILVKKEEREEFDKKLFSLPDDVLDKIKFAADGGNLSVPQKETLINLLSGVFDWNPDQLLKKWEGVRKKYADKQYLGVADENGMSVFYGLSPGHAFWLVSQLTRYQQLALFIKLGYLNERECYCDFSVKNELHKAKKSIIRLRRNFTNRTPVFNKKVPEYLKSLVENSENRTQRTLGPNQTRVLNYFTLNPNRVNELQGIDRLIVTLLVSGQSAYSACGVSKDVINHGLRKLAWSINKPTP